jgi:uracil phosphoribosyltransferase
VKLPDDLSVRDVILLDPMLATGNSDRRRDRDGQAGWSDVGAAHRAHRGAGGLSPGVHRDHPDVHIVVASVDRELNEKGYILRASATQATGLYGTK